MIIPKSPGQSVGNQGETTPICGAPGLAARRWLIAMCGGVVGIYLLFIVIFALRVGPADQDQFLVFHELQYWNSALFGLTKQWSPLLCSGLSLAGEPQVPFMSLSMALGYLFGPFWGLKLATVLYLAAGWTGAYGYAGLWLREPLQRGLAASLFIGNGFFVCRVGFGHVDFVPFLMLPLVLWMLHVSAPKQRGGRSQLTSWQLVGATLCLGALLSLAIDGSPVAIIHLLFWISLYALTLALSVRNWTPVIMLCGAAAMANLMDAGYLWPMIDAQSDFPRRTPESFTSVLSLMWFALLPVRGKLLPANGLGHELSVFVGPVILWALWRYRHWLRTDLPGSMKYPLMAVTIASIVMGMGSLEVLHVPRWLSPFDLLRPLPGFRSLGVTGRFWGFLALPLSLLGAAALWSFVSEPRSNCRLALWMGAALLLQFGFQTETIFSHWFGTQRYHAIPWQDRFRRGPQSVRYVATAGRRLQGEFITPTQGVVNCYDMDDFIHADIGTGTQLVRQTLVDGHPGSGASDASAQFAGWNQIQLRINTVPDTLRSTPTRVQWVLNQAYHRNWRAPGCAVDRGAHGNLIVDCPVQRLDQGALTVTFYDELSARAASISVLAWRLWIGALGGLLLALCAARVHTRVRTARRVRLDLTPGC